MFENTEVQLCIVHLVRSSLKNVSYRDRGKVVQALRKIYNAVNETEGLEALEQVKKEFDTQYPQVSKIWEGHWENISPIFKYPHELRKKIYTTNAIESLNNYIRKIIKNKRVFPHEASAVRLIYLAIQKKLQKWDMQIQQWNTITVILEIHFKERFTNYQS